MAGSSFFALFDDIATLLDDVAILSKVAAKKTAGVLGDDLALNAQQVAGVQAERELPVVWAVAKGSFINKLILVPAALALSAFAKFLIIPLLMIGGAYLCFEGVEKILHAWLHNPKEDREHHKELINAVVNEEVDMVKFERDKIAGAIRTDFILSAEIIVIALGTMSAVSLGMQSLALAAIAILMTVGVYGLVALIVKMDDAGFALIADERANSWAAIKRTIGSALVAAAGPLMRGLSFFGTLAMFLVGGSIITHNVPALHHWLQELAKSAGNIAGWLATIAPMVADLVIGIIVGLICVAAWAVVNKLRGKPAL
jgi:uncharacterized protein